MFQGAIFDMDGVIVDSHFLHKEAWRRLFNLLGKAVTEEQLEFVRDGRKRSEIIRHFLGELPPAQLEAYGQQKDAFFLDTVDRLSLVPGLLDFVIELRGRGIRLAVATSARRKRTDYILNRFALRTHFEAVVTGDDVSKGKPDPALFEKACAEIRCLPGKTLVVEDAASGIQGARQAGMKCLGIAAQARSQLLYDAGADWVQPDFTGVKVSALANLFLMQPESVPAGRSRLALPEVGGGRGAARLN